MRVAIIGGDQRMLYAAREFQCDGDTVCVAGFEKAELPVGLNSAPAPGAAVWAEIIVLPVRPLSQSSLNAPYADSEMTLTQLSRIVGNKPVFSGCAEQLHPLLKGPVYDYSKREEFSIRNAVLTAEGVLALLINNSAESVFGAKILVIGYGRIGRVLCRMLRDMGAEVTAAARREASRAWARAEGVHTCGIELSGLEQYRFVVNTVPSMVLPAPQIARLSRDALIVDLASAPGGVDQKAAEATGVRCIHALALPGRTAPAAAGRIIKDTIGNIIKEENGG